MANTKAPECKLFQKQFNAHFDLMTMAVKNHYKCISILTEKLLSSNEQELCGVLSSLKQVFHEDKNLVNGFVTLGGLDCLVQIGSKANQNCQNYILRALGQVNMLNFTRRRRIPKPRPKLQ